MPAYLLENARFKTDSNGNLMVEYVKAVPETAVKWNGFHFNVATGALYVRDRGQ